MRAGRGLFNNQILYFLSGDFIEKTKYTKKKKHKFNNITIQVEKKASIG